MAMNVKFLRGVIANYNSLAEKNADTLYFCTDGALYLGAKKIANWTDLTDVNAAIKALQDAGYQNAEQVGAAITEALKPYAKTADIQSALDKANSALQAADLADYAKTADVVAKTTYEEHLTAQSEVDAEQNRRLGVIEADYLKAADKTELEGKITSAQTKADDAYVLADAAQTADEVSSAIAAAIEGLNINQYTTEEEVLATVNAAIAGVSDSDTINSIAELVNYLNTHGGEATSMAAAIATLEGKVQTIEGKPAYNILSTDIEAWNAEKGAKELAQGVKDVVDTNKATWDKASTALQAADLADYAKTADVESKIATAKSEAISEAASDAANKYVAKEGYVEFTQTEKDKLAGLENYDDTEVKGLIEAAKKAGDDAQADVDALELVIANETTGLAAAHTKAQAGIDAAATADAKAVAAQGEVDALELVVAQNAQTCQNNFTTISNQLTWGEF